MAHRNPGAFFSLIHSQLFIHVPTPTQSFADQTVIVTGSNTGLGREAANHIVRLGASKVILGVRSVSKGEEAKKYIEESTGRKGVVEVWPLDLASYESVKAFVRRAEGLERLDVVLENAGVLTNTFSMAEGNEQTLTVNVISTLLLAFMILPKLHESARLFNTVPRLSIVSSDIHAYTTLPAKSHPAILAAMNDRSTAMMGRRYQDSKLIQILYLRILAAEMTKSASPRVILNFLSPGFCDSEILRQQNHLGVRIARRAIARSSEEGSRSLVAAVVKDGVEGTHGEYMFDGVVTKPSAFVRSEQGAQTGRRLWKEINDVLDQIQPGVLENV